MHGSHARHSCVFCQIAAGTLPAAKVYEDDQTFASWIPGRSSPGHCLLIPRSHFETLTICRPTV